MDDEIASVAAHLQMIVSRDRKASGCPSDKSQDLAVKRKCPCGATFQPQNVIETHSGKDLQLTAFMNGGEQATTNTY